MRTHKELRRAMVVAVCCAVASAVVAGPEIDTSPDRATTALNPGLKQIGTIKPRSANEIAGSNWTLGCETLDRDFADYQQYKEYLVPLGIKTIRLQGGWAKTEKVKGTYDFAWLDTIIDDALGRGLNILLETGYGDTNYVGGGGRDLSGGFPTSAEGLTAYDRWVEAMATKFALSNHPWTESSRNSATGQNFIVLWDNSGTPDDSFETRPAQVEVKGLSIHEPVWVDLVSGRIYEIPADRVLRKGETALYKDIPLYDAPVLLAEKNSVLK